MRWHHAIAIATPQRVSRCQNLKKGAQLCKPCLRAQSYRVKIHPHLQLQEKQGADNPVRQDLLRHLALINLLAVLALLDVAAPVKKIDIVGLDSLLPSTATACGSGRTAREAPGEQPPLLMIAPLYQGAALALQPDASLRSQTLTPRSGARPNGSNAVPPKLAELT